MKYVNYQMLYLLLVLIVFILIVVVESEDSDKVKRKEDFEYFKSEKQAKDMIVPLFRWQRIGFPDVGSHELAKTLNPIEPSKLHQNDLMANNSVTNMARKPFFV